MDSINLAPPIPDSAKPNISHKNLFLVVKYGSLIKKFPLLCHQDDDIKCSCCHEKNLNIYINKDKLNLCLTCSEKLWKENI